MEGNHAKTLGDTIELELRRAAESGVYSELSKVAVLKAVVDYVTKQMKEVKS